MDKEDELLDWLARHDSAELHAYLQQRFGTDQRRIQAYVNQCIREEKFWNKCRNEDRKRRKAERERARCKESGHTFKRCKCTGCGIREVRVTE